MLESLAGELILADQVLEEKPVTELRYTRRNSYRIIDAQQVRVPAGHTVGVPEPIWDSYRVGCMSCSVDVVLCVRRHNLPPAVLLIKRREDKPFPGKWWVIGGTRVSYLPEMGCLGLLFKREIGLDLPPIEARIGQYATHCDRFLASTQQNCYVTTIDEAELNAARPDGDHDKNYGLFTVQEYNLLPSGNTHPYIRRVISLALQTMPAGPDRS